MATPPRVRVSESPAQHNNREQRHKSSGFCNFLSWLFGGCISKDSHDQINENSSEGHTTMQHLGQVGENHVTDSGKVSDVAKVSDGVKPAAGETVGSESVDTEAEDFIARQRKKLEKERLLSMKRVESMLNRGL